MAFGQRACMFRGGRGDLGRSCFGCLVFTRVFLASKDNEPEPPNSAGVKENGPTPAPPQISGSRRSLTCLKRFQIAKAPESCSTLPQKDGFWNLGKSPNQQVKHAHERLGPRAGPQREKYPLDIWVQRKSQSGQWKTCWLLLKRG